MRLGKFSSSTCTISTGAPQGCVLSRLLFSLYTNDYTSKDPSVKLLKFADDTTVIGLIQDCDKSADRRLRSWLSGAVLTTWSSTHLKLWRWSWTSGEMPLHSPPHSPIATGAAETVRLCHHWIRPLHVNNCLVQLSYQIWPQKTMEGSPNCWANHWYNPPHSPRTVLIQSEQKGWQNHSGPLTSSILHLGDATELWAPERPDTGTVSSRMQSISWTPDITGTSKKN